MVVDVVTHEGPSTCVGMAEREHGSVVGSNQSLGAFWKRIEAYFNNNKDFLSTCNKKSLQGRWMSINGMVQKFCGHYARALRTRRSGRTKTKMVRYLLFQ